ncbi:anthranilate synthase, component I [Magnetococcus marinus MC-1]|uniref:Anthranilate synthase component 1 n=1 Tax=Magnetococcus marinus (strain ATCC BAA-1437 / JCM 17883 / MC-1) TaxID=156889 RepID=A0L6P4_MAGMM|nr:anthranilate synthase component I [Magnetococcus marinus]ABK43637.1 anthranilate synthase, component I [Magnetococcus marinus MC-1]
MIQPSFEAFQTLMTQGNLIPVYREIMADLDTPVTAYMKIAAQSQYSFLLESVQGGEKWGRFSLIGTQPKALFEVNGNTISYHDLHNGTVTTTQSDNPTFALREIMATYQPVPTDNLPSFGGAVGYLGYDTVRYYEHLPDDNPDTLGTPDALFMLSDQLLVFDNLYNKLKVVVNVHLTDESDPRACYDKACEQINRLIALLRAPMPPLPDTRTNTPLTEADFTSEMSREAFEEAVRKGKEYIFAGDIMQVVLSQRLSVPFNHDPLALYRALRMSNPSPYLFLLNMGQFSLVGSSPEILVRQEKGIATVRPIAGTRPRGKDEAEDLALETELLADPKERAEHIMLVDLGRNDIGRIAEIGSVKVTEQFIIERYSHVMHIVSNVEGVLRKDLDAYDVVAATFPAGTLSGAPKIRAMEIIDELEVSRRGPYGGAVGYFGYNGYMDLAITIRTAILKDGRLYIQAGAGIVADSVPSKEYEETMNKGRAMFRAVEQVQKGLE